uniref:Protein TAPT1 homolog n=1 Tax=Schistocephalus solidus TaxID=70667 RepID=A0A0V0J1P8_SCHSO
MDGLRSAEHLWNKKNNGVIAMTPNQSAKFETLFRISSFQIIYMRSSVPQRAIRRRVRQHRTMDRLEIESTNFSRSLSTLSRPLGRYQLHAVDARDLVKFSFVCLCTLFLYTFDSSIAYHEIRTQSVIKIYIFFNLLEVADRLLSAVNLDAIDDILFTVKAKLMSGKPDASGSRPACSGDNPQPPGSNPSPASASTSVTWGSFILQYTFALLCVAAHCLLLLAQVTTLNVAFNSQNRSLLTVMISNNFIELKSNVFRKMGKSNLFQIACADVRERFHYSVWLFIIVCRNMSATGWQSDDFLGFLPDIFLIFGAEVAVDWVKHAFISKFNVIPSDVYEEYTVSIAYDLLLCRQGKNSADYFELLARRMGLTPISLSCLINVMLIQTVRSSWLFLIISVAVPLMFLVKLLAHLLLLRLAYNHVHAYTVAMTTKLSTGAAAAGGGTSDMASSAGAQGAPVSSTDAMRYATSAAAASIPTDTVKSQKRGVFFHPYTGYDLPTRDDGQFAMPHPVIPQRSHSDSTCLSIPQMAEAGGSLRLGIGAGGQPSDHSSLRGAGGSAEEFASLTSVPSTFTTGVGSSGSKRGILKPTVPAAAIDLSVAAGFASLFDDEVSNTSYKTATQSWLDSSDMHVRRRKNAVPLNSLSMESSEANTLESLSQHDADSEGPFGPAEEGHVAFIGAECFKVHHFDQPLINRHLRGFSEATSTPARWKRGQMPLRRCCSLDSLRLWQPCRTLSPRVMASEKGDEAKQLQQEPKASAPCAHRSNRRRVHTENEVSTVLILEQLSSLLNDESAHLEDAADDDSSDMNGEVEQEDRRPESSADAASSLTEPVKQPLSNVDRYSMLGGQIS